MKNIDKYDVKRLSEKMTQLKTEFENNTRLFPIQIGAIRVDEERTIDELNLGKYMDNLTTLYYNGEDEVVTEYILSVVELLNNLYNLYQQHHEMLTDMNNLIAEKTLKSTYVLREEFAPTHDDDDEW